MIGVMASSVLIVDDDPAFLSLATRVLEDMGVDVVATAQSAVTAVAAANASKPDAALVDIGLPDRDGIELAYELAALPWGPRVVLTSTDEDAASAIEPRDGRPKLPFVPKHDLPTASLRRLLTAA
jgi:CheY-like chemotaxis protein